LVISEEEVTRKEDTSNEEPNMNKLIVLCVVPLLVGVTAPTLAGSQKSSADVGVSEWLIGAWQLAWLEEEGPDGKVHRADCTGMLVYTRDGHMSVQVMYREPQTGSPSGPVQYAQGGYEASYGTYQIDEGARTFTYHVDGALVRRLIGKDLTRIYEFAGKQLIVKSSSPNEHWRVAWEHY
jgi:hypothetical protein